MSFTADEHKSSDLQQTEWHAENDYERQCTDGEQTAKHVHQYAVTALTSNVAIDPKPYTL